MSGSRAGLLVALLLSWQGAAQVTTIPFDLFPENKPPISCGYQTSPNYKTVNFIGTASADWSTLVVRIPMAYTSLVSGPPTVTAALNGQQIGSPVTVTNDAGVSCGVYQTYEFRSNSLSSYVALGTNVLSITYTGGAPTGGPGSMTFTTDPATFLFDAPSKNPDIKFLTHKYRSEGTYPSPLVQLPTRDTSRPQLRFSGQVTAGSSGASRDIWFRVVDPEDPSSYRLLAGKNDNRDPQPKGILTTATCASPSCRVPGGTGLKLRSSPTGFVEVVLEGTDQYAGDNYQIEASFDAHFGCATAGAGGANTCAQSGIATAWKRVYVEVHKMFRTGGFITRDLSPGDTVIPVEDVSVFPPAPFSIRLIHAPEVWDGSRTAFSDDEVVQVLEVVGRRAFGRPGPGDLHLRTASSPTVGDALTKHYTGPRQAGSLPTPRAYLADAVGVVTGPLSGYEHVDTFLLQPLFEEAYVDVVYLTDDNGRDWQDPLYQRVIPRVALIGIEQEWLTRRWIRNASPFGYQRIARPNHHFVFLADRTPGARGLATVGDGFNDLWLFAGMLPHPIMRAEAFVHEMTHLWRVNNTWWVPPATGSTTGGHCDIATGTVQLAKGHSGLLCVMHSTLYGATGTPEGADRIVGFHLVTNASGREDSEYFGIRDRTEPVPQIDRARSLK